MDAIKSIYKILVLDANQRSALAVVRSLGRDSSIYLLTADDSKASLAGASRFSQSYAQYPSCEAQPDEFIHWLKEFTIQNQIDLVIPVTEITSQLILMNQSILPRVTLPFPDYKRVMHLAHKGELLRLAATLGLDIPRSKEYKTADEIDFGQLIYPLILKPCLSRIFCNNQWFSTQVQLIDSETELRRSLAKQPELMHCGFLLQEFIPGKGAGVFCLFDNGQPVAFFAHRRLREKPPQGGVSVLSESVEVDEKLREQSTLLLSAAKWQGVAMIEFRVAPSGKAYLMEVNTRFWGSLQLAIDAGVNFPLLLVQRHLQLPSLTPKGYHIGVKLRWLLGDLDSLYLFLKSKVAVSQKLRRILQFINPDFKNTRHEIDRWEDWAPAWFELKQYIRQLLGR